MAVPADAEAMAAPEAMAVTAAMAVVTAAIDDRQERKRFELCLQKFEPLPVLPGLTYHGPGIGAPFGYKLSHIFRKR